MAYHVARKKLTLLAKEYRPGDPVDTAGLNGSMVLKLMNAGYLVEKHDDVQTPNARGRKRAAAGSR